MLVETVPSYEGIATSAFLILSNFICVETVPSCKGIATIKHFLCPFLPILVETVPSCKGIATASQRVS